MCALVFSHTKLPSFSLVTVESRIRQLANEKGLGHSHIEAALGPACLHASGGEEDGPIHPPSCPQARALLDAWLAEQKLHPSSG